MRRRMTVCLVISASIAWGCTNPNNHSITVDNEIATATFNLSYTLEAPSDGGFGADSGEVGPTGPGSVTLLNGLEVAGKSVDIDAGMMIATPGMSAKFFLSANVGGQTASFAPTTLSITSATCICVQLQSGTPPANFKGGVFDDCYCTPP